MTEAEARLLKPGQRVSRRGSLNERQDVTEYGVVVMTYLDASGDTDVYVAFFGESWPAPGAPPKRKPYILRYYGQTLHLEEDR